MDNLELHSLDLNHFPLKINHYENIGSKPHAEQLKLNERTIFDFLKMEQLVKLKTFNVVLHGHLK